jgi:glycosyltransferase involved in cell wall biosynthesis
MVTDRYPPHPGGLARSSQRLANHAGSSGAVAHVLVTREESPPGSLSSLQDGRIWVHRVGTGDAVESSQQAAQVIQWLHGSEGFDLIHGQYASTGGYLAALLARQLGIAAYVSARGNDLDRDAHDPARLPSLLWALERAHAVGAVSRALVRQVQALAGRADALYTPNSVDASVFAPQPPDLALRDRLHLGSGPVIGFAGELRRKKGAEFLLEGFRRLPAEAGAQLLLVGAIRSEARLLLDRLLADEPESGRRVHLWPYTQVERELAALYNLMDVVVCPSLWEGMPNSVLEAMACGRPVLASDAGGIPDVVAHGETGWLLPRHRLHHLHEALREVLTLDPSERRAVGERARAHVAREFTPERERRELQAAYDTALARV